MTQLEMNIDTRLSYSSARLLQGCEQKYFHYKVKKTPIDNDASKDTTAFKVGTAFHHILEVSNHQKPEKIGKLLEYCVQEIGLPEEDVALVHAMVLKYLRLRSKQTLRAVKCEHTIDDDQVIGFIDLVEEDTETGKWYISDLKTAKTFWATTTAKLPQDRQLNLYASYADVVAKDLGLDPKKFAGCRYKVTTKSQAKQRAGESYVNFVKRLTDTYIKSYDIIVPIEKMSPKDVKKEHLRLHKLSMKLREGKQKPTKNFGYCETYFKPCEYWSQCHGGCFSDMQVGLEVIEEK